MNEACDETTAQHPGDNDSEPLAASLEGCFESEEEFDKLPPHVRELIKRALGPAMADALWTVSTPHRRRQLVQIRDIERHPGLENERRALWEKNREIDRAERTASNIPVENRTMSDVQSQKEALRKLRQEEAALEDALQKKTQSLGLRWPYARTAAILPSRNLSACQVLSWIAYRHFDEPWDGTDESTRHQKTIDLSKATHELVDALEREQIVAWGRLWDRENNRPSKGERVPIPGSVFRNPEITLTVLNEVVVSGSSSLDVILNYNGREFTAVLFDGVDVIHAWPSSRDAILREADAAATAPVPNRFIGTEPKLIRYPNYNEPPLQKEMTPCEVLCWIGYRRAIPSDLYLAPLMRPGVVAAGNWESRPHESIPGPKPDTCPIQQATEELMKAVKEAKLTARDGDGDGGNVKTIPLEVYDQALVFNVRDSFEPDAGAETRDLNRVFSMPVGGRVCYKDVFFLTREVLAIWPAASPAAPDGFVFIDIAVERIMDQMQEPQGPATQRLLDKLSVGGIRSRLRKGPNWDDLDGAHWKSAHIALDRFRESKRDRPHGLDGLRLKGGQYHLHSVLIAADDFDHWLNELLPRGKETLLPADQRTAGGELHQPPATAETLAAVTDPSPLLQRPRPSELAQVEWLRQRVATWPDDRPAPSEETDWHAARGHFRGPITRDEFRLIREKNTPEEWRMQGRRRAWGKVRNSAENSAKPRPLK